MAKVISPLLSFSASGKIGKSMVFFSHLGRNVVRQLVIPKNTKTGEQGSQRLLVGAMGASTSVVQKTGEYYASAKTSIPAGQTWVSDFVKKMCVKYGTGAVGVGVLQDAFAAAAEKGVFTSSAATLGLSNIELLYAEPVNNLDKGVLLYMLAIYGYDRHAKDASVFTESIFATNPDDWTSGNISTFVGLLS